MENRERDRVSQRSSPTEAGELNRRVEEEKGREHNSGTSAEFGQKIGRSENLESGRSSGSMGGGKSSGSDKSSDDDRSDNRSWKDSSEGRH